MQSVDSFMMIFIYNINSNHSLMHNKRLIIEEKKFSFDRMNQMIWSMCTVNIMNFQLNTLKFTINSLLVGTENTLHGKVYSLYVGSKYS